MRNNSYAPHYAISRYSIREFKTGAEPFMVAMIIIIILLFITKINQYKGCHIYPISIIVYFDNNPMGNSMINRILGNNNKGKCEEQILLEHY